MRSIILGVLCGGVGLLAAETYRQTTLNSAAEPVYRNNAYEFEVTLPKDVTYTRTAPPNPDHGLVIVLNKETRLWVDATYSNSSLTTQEIDRQLIGCKLAERRPAVLGGAPAEMARFDCPAMANDPAYHERLVLSVRKRRGRSPICYQVGLKTFGESARTADELFDKLVAGFRYNNAM